MKWWLLFFLLLPVFSAEAFGVMALVATDVPFDGTYIPIDEVREKLTERSARFAVVMGVFFGAFMSGFAVLAIRINGLVPPKLLPWERWDGMEMTE